MTDPSSDLQDTDADVHRSMLWLLGNDISEVTDMHFDVDYDLFGEVVTHELVPGGSEILVSVGLDTAGFLTSCPSGHECEQGRVCASNGRVAAVPRDGATDVCAALRVCFRCSRSIVVLFFNSMLCSMM